MQGFQFQLQRACTAFAGRSVLPERAKRASALTQLRWLSPLQPKVNGSSVLLHRRQVDASSSSLAHTATLCFPVSEQPSRASLAVNQSRLNPACKRRDEADVVGLSAAHLPKGRPHARARYCGPTGYAGEAEGMLEQECLLVQRHDFHSSSNLAAASSGRSAPIVTHCVPGLRAGPAHPLPRSTWSTRPDLDLVLLLPFKVSKKSGNFHWFMMSRDACRALNHSRNQDEKKRSGRVKGVGLRNQEASLTEKTTTK